MAAFESDQRWSHDFDSFSAYVDQERVLGQVVQTSRDGGWDAFDMTKANSAEERNFCIGHYKTRSDAKRAVEDYWSTIE